jgi:uncharacterized protein YaaW (UPF0174 family)
LTAADVAQDDLRTLHYNLTRVDAVRIAMDMFARGLLTAAQVAYVKSDANIIGEVEPILNVNQYLHLAEWLFVKKQLSDVQLKDIQSKLIAIPFTGI